MSEAQEMSKIETSIKEHASSLLSEGVECLIGYDKDGPCFIDDLNEVERLVWNNQCIHNLTKYLPDFEGRVGIIIKGCDSLSLVELIKHNQVSRDRVFIIGILCSGMLNEKQEKYEKCKNCSHPSPVIYDVLLGEKPVPREEDYSDVIELESLPHDERFSFWERMFSKCIKCFACRNICPVCFCKECLIDRREPKWSSKFVSRSEILTYHMTRAFHVADMCTACGECERACPMKIPLLKLYKKLRKDVKELFGYEAGLDLEETPPLISFKEDDPEP